MTTSETIKKLRAHLGITQKELASRLEINQPNISEMEAGKREISIPKLKEYCERLGIDFEIIFKF